MIDDLDTSLENLLAGEATPGSELASATISFGAPDKDWRDRGSGLELNIYLYRLLERRELRSNERRVTHNSDGTVSLDPFPRRLECSYVITAWSKEAETEGTERERQEHRLLDQVLYILWRNPNLPKPYLAPGLVVTQEIELPVISAETEDTATNPDFWSGFATYLRPSITCKATLMLALKQEIVGPAVTTVEVQYEGGDHLFNIGGVIRSANPPHDVIGSAWVRVNETGQVVATNDLGQFVFTRIRGGNYSLTVRAVGFQEGNRAFAVPQPDGVYDLNLSPL